MAKAKTPAHAATKSANVVLTPRTREAVGGVGQRYLADSSIASITRLRTDSSGIIIFWGVPTVILSAVVGSSVFGSLAKSGRRDGQMAMPIVRSGIGVGVVSILVTGLTALQTFLRHGERAEIHRSAGARFAALQKEVHQGENSHASGNLPGTEKVDG